MDNRHGRVYEMDIEFVQVDLSSWNHLIHWLGIHASLGNVRGMLQRVDQHDAQ